MRSLIVIVLVAFAAILVAGRNIDQKYETKRLFGLPSVSEIKDRLKDRFDKTVDKIKDKILEAILAGGDIAYDLAEKILENETIKPYAEKLRTVMYEIKQVGDGTEYEWAKLRDDLLTHIRELFQMFMAEEEVKAIVDKLEATIDDIRGKVQSSKEKAANIRRVLGTYVWTAILAVGAPVDLIFGGLIGKRDLAALELQDHMVMKRFFGFLPSISDIKAKITQLYGSAKEKLIEKILAGGDIAYDLLARVIANDRTRPYAEALRTILYEIKGIISAHGHEWTKLRARLLQHIQDLLDHFMSHDKVQAAVQKIAATIDRAREAAKTSKDAAYKILDSLKVILWAGVLGAGAQVDMVVGGTAKLIFDIIMG